MPRGSRDLAETLLLRTTAYSHHGIDVQTAFENLSPYQQRARLELHGHASETLINDNNWDRPPVLNRKALAIYAANFWGQDVFG